MKSIAITLAIAAFAVAGCASQPVPADQYANTRAAIKSAEMLNADKNPQAALHLKLAKEELTKGTEALKNRETELANSHLLRAEADANAAVHLAKGSLVKEEAFRTTQAIQQAKARTEVSQP